MIRIREIEIINQIKKYNKQFDVTTTHSFLEEEDGNPPNELEITRLGISF